MSQPFRTTIDQQGEPNAEIMERIDGGLLEEYLMGASNPDLNVSTAGIDEERLLAWARHPDERIPMAIIEQLGQHLSQKAASPYIHEPPWTGSLFQALRTRARQEDKLWSPLLDAFWSTPTCRKSWDGHAEEELPPAIEGRLTRLQRWVRQRLPEQEPALQSLLDFQMERIPRLVAREAAQPSPELVHRLMEKEAEKISDQLDEPGGTLLAENLLENPGLGTEGLEILYQYARQDTAELLGAIAVHPESNQSLRYRVIEQIAAISQQDQNHDLERGWSLQRMFQSDPRIRNDPTCWHKAPEGLGPHVVRTTIGDRGACREAREAALWYGAQFEDLRGRICELVLREPKVVQQLSQKALLPLLSKADERYRADLIRLVSRTDGPDVEPPRNPAEGRKR